MSNTNQLEVKQIIDYKWWEVGDVGVFQEHFATLKQKADDHIKEMIQKGFTSGELPTVKYASFDAMYTGFWELKNLTKF